MSAEQFPDNKNVHGPSIGLSLSAGLICVVLIGIDLRPALVSIGPLIDTIQSRFSLSHAEASLLTTIPEVMMGLLAVPAPGLARRYGRDRVILAALALLSVATIARALSTETLLLYLSTAAVGCGIAIAGALVGGFIKANFPTRAPLLVGIYGAALGLGATLSAAVTGPMATHLGWRLAAGFWAVLGLTALAAWLFVLSRHDARITVASRRYSLPFRDRKAWLIGLFFAADNFLFYALVSWIVPMLRERQVSEVTAGLVLASFTIGLSVGMILAGAISFKSDRRIFLAGFSTLTLLGLIAIALSPTMAPFVFMPMISFGIGGCFALGMTLPLDNTRDPDEANTWSAFAILIAYLIAATGPLFVGALRDITYSFDLPFQLLTLVGLAMLGLTPFLTPKSKKA
ncbi:CynX/NimT family MFS transporter [Acidisoma sp. L85]|uniref:MFS transporter n=1 Tax=Acidisoma sp. L85 TaxID=1641850 RepID=UPI001C20468A|nr:MFS transporter [Acidisoma sp. L85]